MATIVAAGALSHSPLINSQARHSAQDERAIQHFRRGAREMGRRLAQARPDVLVIFGPDHFRSMFYDQMPSFCLGVGHVSGWADWGTLPGPFATAPHLARQVLASLLAASFDPTFSYDLRVDHGISQPLQLWDEPALLKVPLLPIVINTSAPPLPTPERSFALGQAVGRALRESPDDLRVAVVGSGGLSHTPPASSVESEHPADRERVERLIHGRGITTTPDQAQAREQGLLAIVGDLAGGVAPEWDTAILARLARGEARQLAHEASYDWIEQGGGNGGQEIRTWLAAAGAVDGAAFETLSYDPVPALITGMGVAWAVLDRAE